MLRIAIIPDTSSQTCFAICFETVILLIQILTDYNYILYPFSVTIVSFLGIKYMLEIEKYFLIFLASISKNLLCGLIEICDILDRSLKPI